MTSSPRLWTLSAGHSYPEGPCLSPSGTLHVVELAAGAVAEVSDGVRTVVATTPGSPNGAVFDVDGTLYLCNNGGHWGPNASTGRIAGRGGQPALIQCLRPGRRVETLLEAIDGCPLSAPNDIVLDRNGGLWFTDPVWAERDSSGRAPAAASPPGAVCYVGRDGLDARRVHEGLIFPNGLCITPDESAILVGETGTGRILRFEIVVPGAVASPTVHADLGPDSFPDGMCFDAEGRLLVAGTGSGAIFVVSPDGKLEQRLPMLDDDVTNVCFAGRDGRTLVVTEASLGRVSALRWPVPGHRLPASPAPW